MSEAVVNSWKVDCSPHGFPYWASIEHRGTALGRFSDEELYDLYRALKVVLDDQNGVRASRPTPERTFDL